MAELRFSTVKKLLSDMMEVSGLIELKFFKNAYKPSHKDDWEKVGADEYLNFVKTGRLPEEVEDYCIRYLAGQSKRDLPLVPCPVVSR